MGMEIPTYTPRLKKWHIKRNNWSLRIVIVIVGKRFGAFWIFVNNG